MNEVCIIGAGSSGIAALKVFKQAGLAVDCYEKGSAIGGNWRYNNDNGMSSAYRSLHINTSREMMAYSDYPMPADYPDYPHHSQIITYFEDYVDHFDIRRLIRFNTAVNSVTREENGMFRVTTEDGSGRHYHAVVVANGHHWDPHYPQFEGKFSGKMLHSHYYKTPEPYAGKRVLIVGIGNSAVDIACELSRSASRVVVSSRSWAHILPKYVFGRPTDTLARLPLPFLPLSLQQRVLQLTLWIARGSQESYGVPKPARRLLQEHPTVSADLLNLVGHGRLHLKPNISRLDGASVHFSDDSSEKFDQIIYATGYNICFPFLSEELVSLNENRIRLYHHAVHPDIANLFFLGLIQPLGAIMPLAEVQAHWFAGILTGKVALPSPSHMHRTIDQNLARMQKRYNRSPRHTIQVDFYPYRQLIQREMKKYRRRPQAQIQQVPETVSAT